MAPKGEQNPAYNPSRCPVFSLRATRAHLANYAPSRSEGSVSLSLRDLTDRFDVLFHTWEKAGRQLYLVGGCVRDVIMKLSDIGDIDLTTDARPEETSQLLLQAGFPAYPIGARFGTISTIVDGTPIEITTFRVEEHYEAGSRKPHVTFGESLEHDLSRRDLSINAMAAGRGGSLYDPFDGQRAIEERILEVPRGGLENTVGILSDDPLRLLRIARFCARFAFLPTEETTEAAKMTARELEHISHERWKMELDKTLVAPHLDLGLRWLNEVGAFGVLFPSFDGRHAETETLIEATVSAQSERITRWGILFLAAAWMHHQQRLPDLSLPVEQRPDLAQCAHWAGRAARHFRFSNEEREMVRRLCASTLDTAQLAAAPWDRITRRRFLYEWGGLYDAALELAHAWSPEPLENYPALREEMIMAFATEDVDVRLPHGFGRAVLEDLGVPPGPRVAETIGLVRQAIVDGELPNGAESALYLDFLRRQLS